MDDKSPHSTRYAANEAELHYLRTGAGVVVVALLAGLVIMSLLREPEVDWVLGLAAATIVLGVSTVIGARQWLRDRPR